MAKWIQVGQYILDLESVSHVKWESHARSLLIHMKGTTAPVPFQAAQAEAVYKILAEALAPKTYELPPPV